MDPDNERSTIRSLVSVLGLDAIHDTIAPFVDYLETAVVVIERDETTVSKGIAGNRYCELLINSSSGPGKISPCEASGHQLAAEAMVSGKQETSVCHGGMALCASPIFAEGETVGIVVGAVSEVPSDETIIRAVAEACDIDFETLWEAASQAFHKPAYLYPAARNHLNLLARTLGKFYEHALQRERSIAQIIDREQKLSETNQFLNSLLSGMAEGVFTADLEDRFTYCNRAASEIVGYTPEEFLQMSAQDLIPEDQMPKVIEMNKRRQQGAVDNYELEVTRKDGERLTISQTVAPLYKGEDIIGKVGVVTDVTEKQRLENDLREQNRRLTLMQSLMAKGISGLASGKVFETLAEEVPQALGYDYCSIFVASKDRKRLDLVARNGAFEEDFDRLNASGIHDLDNPLFRITPAGMAFIEDKQVVVDDATRFEGFDRVREVAKGLGSRSMVSTPLKFQGEMMGIMVIHTRDLHTFSDRELEFLGTVAAQVSSIIGSGHTYELLKQSRENYQELYNSAADWMYTLDEEGTILDCNDTMVQALGYRKEEIIGHKIYDFETEEDRKKAKTAIKDTASGGSFTAERRFVSRAGDSVIVEVHARVVHENEDDSYKWLATGRDVTEKKETERRINLLAAALENTRESVIISDTSGKIVSINEAGARACGYSPEELIGMHMMEIVSEVNPEGLAQEIRRGTTAGGWEGQLLFKRRDGSSFPVLASTSRVEDEEGNTIALVGIHRDISVEQRMTQEILGRNRELAVLNAVSVTAGQSLDLHSILQSCVTSIVESMGYDAGIIFLLDEESQTLKVNATENLPDEAYKSIGEERVGEGFAGIVAARREPLFVDDLRACSIELPLPPGMEGNLSSVAGVPIIAKERLLGVMNVCMLQPHEFSGQEKALLFAVARTIGVAVENARLFDDVMRAKSEWETTFDAMTNGVSIHDRNFRIVRANNALARLLGTTANEVVGKKCFEILHSLKMPIAECPHRRAMAEGKNVTVVVEEASLGLVLNISADPLFDSKGEVIGTVHDIRDITEQEHLRAQVNQSEKLRALGEMAGGVAHDFNNFLTVILGNSQLLLATGEIDQDAREALETIQRAASDATETVRRIQEFTRVRTTRKFTVVDINQVIANAIEVARPRWRDEADARGVRIEMNAELGEMPHVNGNSAELGEVFLNLLLNAADAMPEGGAINISSRVAKDGWIEVKVSDTGCGMDDETKNRVFEPFFSTKGSRGSGLGLSLVYGIVNRHGGSIMVESEPGKGATFSVNLPVASMEDLADTQQTAPEEQAEQGLRHGRVLVIDDEDMIRTLLSDILKRMGQEVETAKAGGEGIQKFRDARSDGGAFDLVLTDLGMPEMSGWDVVEQIKEMSPETPVALITGWGDQLDPGRMKESRVDLVMAKPFRVEEVKRMAAKALEGKK